MSIYWTAKHQDLIHEYYYAQYTGGTTSGATRNRCITLLMPVFTTMAYRILWNLNWHATPELIQEAVVRMSTHLLPRIQEDKIDSVLKFLFIGTRRYLINESKKQYNRIHFEDIHENIIDNDNADDNLHKEDLRNIILNELDKKIVEQRVINRTATILLILMKEYLIEHDMCPSGFKPWVIKRMKIKASTYSSIMGRIGIRRKLFNDDDIDDDVNHIYNNDGIIDKDTAKGEGM